jgi:hypothetical protein
MPPKRIELAKAPSHDIIGIKVKFTLESKTRLRKVLFGLEKNTEGDEITWVIDFQLFERDNKGDDYGDPLVDLQVDVDSTLNKRAEAAAKNGLTPGQAAHAIGPAAADSKAAAAGEIDKDEASQTVQATLKKK